MAYGSWSLTRDCLLNLYFIDVYHKFLKEFEHVNCITSTMPIAILKRVKKGTEKNYFTIHRITLVTLDNLSKCNIIKVSTKTEIL